MKLIVGLGNPGEKYKNTRHNVGFMFLDYLVRNSDHTFKEDKYLHGEIAVFQNDITLLKPSTFMNLSGKALNACVTRYKLHVSQDILVAYDDLDIPLGKFKIQKDNRPKTHNGLDSIDEHLHTSDYWRLRIGIDNRDPQQRVSGEAYTLQDFIPEEQEIIEETFAKILLHPVWLQLISKP